MTFPAPVVAACAYLNERAAAADDPVRAYGGVVRDRPARFVRLMLVGTTSTDVGHCNRRITAECWEQSEEAAERLGDLIQGWLREMDIPEGHVPQGPRGWVGGPYSQPDPESGIPRSVMTFILRQKEQ